MPEFRHHAPRAPAARVILVILALATLPVALRAASPAQSPPPVRSLYDEALARYRAADYGGAVVLLQGIPDKGAGDFNLLGWAHLKSGDPETAVLQFRKAIALDPASGDSYCGLGYAHYRSRAPAEALAAFDNALARDPGNADCLLGRGLALEELGDDESALETFRRVLQADGTNPTAGSRVRALARPPRPQDGATENVEFFARGNHFWVSRGGKDPEPLYVKGVNFGFALPGKYSTEFPEGEETYIEWLRLAGEMNANCVRVYTILPPSFYTALRRYNEGRRESEKIHLIQGIWAELPDAGRFRSPAYATAILQEIRNAVDAVHGNGRIPKRRGHAHGAYGTDVSDLVLGYIFGREWEPPEILAFNRTSTPASHDGRFLAVSGATPMEAWLTEMLDRLVAYETDRYGRSRPVAFMNWPPVDPLFHPSESTLREEFKFRKAMGETLPEVDFDKSFDEDSVSLDEMKIRVRPAFRGGIFASYHVYPYNPDFLINEREYGIPPPGSPGAPVRYLNYLRDLKSHYMGLPLLIAEFGVPTSRGVARFHPEGLNHGGHNDESQAKALAAMTRNIAEAGCAGGIVFSLVDEWAKTNWMVRGTEERDPLWYNAQDPEEGYGLFRAVSSSSAGKLTGSPDAWAQSTVLDTARSRTPLAVLSDGHDEARRIRRLLADADPGYLYLRVDLGGRVDWGNAAYLIAIDSIGTAEGDHLLPFRLRYESPVGFESVILLHGRNSRILVDAPYNRTAFNPGDTRFPGKSGYEEKIRYGTVPNRDGRFTEPVTVHRRRFARDGTIFPDKVYNAGILRHGNVESDALADFLVSDRSRMVEIRIPWALLGVTDPSAMRVALSETKRAPTDGLRILAVSYKPRGAADSDAVELSGGTNVTDVLPRDPAGMVVYRWRSWNAPDYVLRPKKSYFAMKDAYAGIGNPKVALHLPGGYDFASVVKLHYGGDLREFLSLYDPDRLGGENLYGRGLAHLVRGLVKNDPFPVLEARGLLAASRDAAADPRERKAAELALSYIESLLSGRYAKSAGEAPPVVRTIPRKDPPPNRPVRRVTIGNTSIRLGKGARIKTQVDRVTRDWLSGLHAAAPGAFSDNAVVPWHEGEKIRELFALTGAEVSVVWGTTVRRIGETWYAPDAEGRYRFPVSEDKVYNYPTTIIVDDRTAVVNDTHGISAIAWDATDADLVIGCGDSEGKVDAAYDLAGRGVDVYMPTDRFLPVLIGVRTPGTIIGSAPVKPAPGGGAVVGDQPVAIDVAETIVVSDFDGVSYPLHYYDTPRRYFEELGRFLGTPLRVVPVVVTKQDGAAVVVEKARRIGAKVIGIRVWGKQEHEAVAAWLREDPARRAVLFHTAVYPEGYRLFFEFPQQTSFGDINPSFE